MGTRGLYGFRKNGIDKLTYNHFDSYPDCLGGTMVEFCKTTSLKEMNEIFDKIVLVLEHTVPTQTQVKECIEYYDSNVSVGSPEDWYCLLRGAQGNPNVYKHGFKYMIDSHNFIEDSLFCEYAYIINLDEECLEFWVGFQKEPDYDNRYGTETHDNMDKYYPCKMIGEYSFECLKEESVECIIASMNRAVEVEFNEDEEVEEERDVTVDDFDDIAYAIRNCSTSGLLDNGIAWRLEFDM
jgi:hypothetical protein